MNFNTLTSLERKSNRKIKYHYHYISVTDTLSCTHYSSSFLNTYCLSSCRPCFHISWLFCCGWISVSFPSSGKDYLIKNSFLCMTFKKYSPPLDKISVICIKSIRKDWITTQKFQAPKINQERKKFIQNIAVLLLTHKKYRSSTIYFTTWDQVPLVIIIFFPRVSHPREPSFSFFLKGNTIT